MQPLLFAAITLLFLAGMAAPSATSREPPEHDLLYVTLTQDTSVATADATALCSAATAAAARGTPFALRLCNLEDLSVWRRQSPSNRAVAPGVWASHTAAADRVAPVFIKDNCFDAFAVGSEQCPHAGLRLSSVPAQP